MTKLSPKEVLDTAPGRMCRQLNFITDFTVGRDNG